MARWLFVLATVATISETSAAQDAFFGLDKLHTLHLDIAAAEWQKMQPTGGPKFPGTPKAPAVESKEKGDVHKSGGAFGTEFPWVKADLSADGNSFKNVGVRFKGNFTYVASAQMLRRPIKIDLDHFDDNAPRLFSQRKLNLANGVTDPARLREALAFAVYRAAGVPAPRTAYAELSLTVPGKYDKENVGLYTLVEQVDKTFLKAHFKSAKGLLLKPENLRGGIEYLGEDWARYDDKYRPKYAPTDEQKKRLIAFARLIHRADDARFRKEIIEYLDVDAFLRFMATDALMANLDSYLGFGHNFYLYLRPDTNQFVFMPWDLDLSMGTWPVGGPPERQIDLSLEHPHIGENRLIDRLFASKEVKDKYVKTLKDLSTTAFAKEKLLADIDVLERTTKDALVREKNSTAARRESSRGPMAGIVGPAPPLRTFIEKRTESVAAQLAGERKGYVAAGLGMPGGPGGGGFPKGPPGGFGPGNFLAKPLLVAVGKDGKLSRDEAIAAVKTLFKEADKDSTGKIDEAQLAAAINALVPRPKNMPAPPPGFGVGHFLAGSVVKRADVAKAGKITLDELTAATQSYFDELDRTKSGSLDETALAAGLNRLVTPPPGFGRLEPPKK